MKKKLGTKSQKKKKKKSLCTIFFLCAVVIFGSIRNTLFREKHTTSTFVSCNIFSMKKLCDFWVKIHPTPFFAIFPKSSGSLKDIKILKLEPVYQQMSLSPKLGVVEISTLWHFRHPLLIQMFIKVTSSHRLSGIRMPFPILSFFLPMRLNLRRGHQTGFGIQVQMGGGGGGRGFSWIKEVNS